MAKTAKEIDWQKIRAASLLATERARVEGRHSSDCSDWCQACGKKVKAIYHVTLARQRICILCAARAGVRDAESHLQKFEPELYEQLLAERKAANGESVV